MLIDYFLNIRLLSLIETANYPVSPSFFRSKVIISLLQVLDFKLFFNPLLEFIRTHYILSFINELSDSIREILLNHSGWNFGCKTFSFVLQIERSSFSLFELAKDVIIGPPIVQEHCILCFLQRHGSHRWCSNKCYSESSFTHNKIFFSNIL